MRVVIAARCARKNLSVTYERIIGPNAALRRAVAPEDFASQLALGGGNQLGPKLQPFLESLHALAAGAVAADDVGVSPLARPADVRVVAITPAIDDARLDGRAGDLGRRSRIYRITQNTLILGRRIAEPAEHLCSPVSAARAEGVVAATARRVYHVLGNVGAECESARLTLQRRERPDIAVRGAVVATAFRDREGKLRLLQRALPSAVRTEPWLHRGSTSSCRFGRLAVVRAAVLVGSLPGEGLDTLFLSQGRRRYVEDGAAVQTDECAGLLRSLAFRARKLFRNRSLFRRALRCALFVLDRDETPLQCVAALLVGRYARFRSFERASHERTFVRKMVQSVLANRPKLYGVDVVISNVGSKLRFAQVGDRLRSWIKCNGRSHSVARVVIDDNERTRSESENVAVSEHRRRASALCDR